MIITRDEFLLLKKRELKEKKPWYILMEEDLGTLPEEMSPTKTLKGKLNVYLETADCSK